MAQFVKVEKEDKLAIITITNPPLNVISRQVFRDLKEVFTYLIHDNETIAVIITGSGYTAFAAGADSKEFPNMFGDEMIKQQIIECHEALNLIATCPKPTIAVLNGITLGGGCELALACDIRIAEEQIQIGLPEVKLGLFPGGGGTQRLPRLIGIAKAKEMMLLGDPISALQAEKIGLVNRIVKRGTGLIEGKNLAAKIAKNSLQSLSRIKQAIDEGFETSIDKGLQLEAELFVEIFRTEDSKEGVLAFIEKRKPVFQHK
ncbi:enoyl-CoA hydratase [Peribacillus loiseleuriae]|uniref:Enoyl-CoA hydratase n=1 Tax=Peribacillus loiseleuriae TaxID=1679170 RepID=A0A0K9GPP4_9BACI|nr:enoyl-CoA hydratase [Peribacillus loiseleuriae]KMY48618.1 enoyl-CoA hydratase [Peribacillus loiseleuriae]